ncbi:hypothetical protein AVEN_268272-1 [Araneus ventricosus]|uniref:Uncharacterized protein n=1 Tax=Araneus ventricosus TaxID=182803 RepID=A0A4Y2C351_ARAVE|nr:hypothetical protein AVEN_268272-1 [Araneus ventricosus]
MQSVKLTVGLGFWDSGTKGAGRLGESRIYSEAFHDALLWKLHSLLAGIHGTRPCGSQLPSAGGFNRLAWRRQQGSRLLPLDPLNQVRMIIRTIFLEDAASPGLRGKRASHGRTYGFSLFKTVASMCASSLSCRYHSAEISRLFKGPLLSTLSL